MGSSYLFLIIGAVLAFLLSYLLGYIVIPFLHKIKFGQTILDIGPNWHKKKQGTPTMGGILFIVGIIFSLACVIITNLAMGNDVLCVGNETAQDAIRVKFYAGLIMAICFGGVGFFDDYIKVTKKRNLGLSIMQKTGLELLIMAGYLLSLYMQDQTYVFIPFYGNVELGIWMIPLGVIVMYCTVNAVNFTDGIDGLCGSVTAVFSAFMIVIAILRGYFGIGLLASCMVGALAGYLIWNHYPAKVMMGDTGSMFLGGLVIAVAYGVDAPWIILIAGIVYVIEFLSDVIQIVYFHLTHGKRLFKMAPIHHHLEKCGWSESKIDVVFCLLTVAGSAIALALCYFGRPV